MAFVCILGPLPLLMDMLSIVVPCYRNEDNVLEAFDRLREMEHRLPTDVTVEYVFVDDGSDDGTYAALLKAQAMLPDRTALIKLTRNVGVYNALLAAFGHARGDCVAVIPPDLQEPVELIPGMFDHWRSGIPVIMTVRAGREDGLLERIGAWIFHRTMRLVVRRDLPSGGYGTGLMDRKVMEDLLRMGEKNSHTLLLLAWLGYPHLVVPYVRQKRERGRSGWSLTKKLKLFIDSGVAFSYLPVRLITLIGVGLGVLSLVYAATVLFSASVDGGAGGRGWPSLMIVLLLTSSFQMIALGVLGEYLWRTLDSVRARPPFVVERTLDERVNSQE